MTSGIRRLGSVTGHTSSGAGATESWEPYLNEKADLMQVQMNEIDEIRERCY